MKPKMIADANKDPNNWLMPLETLTAPLDFGEGAEVLPEGEGGDGLDGVEGEPLGLVGEPLGVVGGVPLAATTLTCSFMPPEQ